MVLTSPPPEHNFDLIPTVQSVEPMKDIRRRVREMEERRTDERRMPEPVG